MVTSKYYERSHHPLLLWSEECPLQYLVENRLV